MTEQEWLSATRPHEMLMQLRPWKRRRRKLVCYVRSSCFRPETWRYLKEPCIQLLQVAERFADGLTDETEYRSAKQAVANMNRRDRHDFGPDGPPEYGVALLSWLRLEHLPGWGGRNPGPQTFNYLDEESIRTREEMRAQGLQVISEQQAIETQRETESFMRDHVHFLRDIFGNPFRPVTLDPRWLSSTVLELAHTIYEEFPRMAQDPQQAGGYVKMHILADALMDAGCDNEEIIKHCQGPGPHVRGCWVVDLILGKA